MTKESKKVEQLDLYWQQFVTNGLVEKGIEPQDLTAPNVALPEYSKSLPRTAMATLKSVLSAECYHRLNGRWRKYKHSQKHNTTTLTIRKETLERLKLIAQKAGLSDDNYDLVLEYLMSPEEDLEYVKIEAEDLLTGLNLNNQLYLLRAKMKLHVSTWRILSRQIEYAYFNGWVECKNIIGRRTNSAREQATIDFMKKIGL